MRIPLHESHTVTLPAIRQTPDEPESARRPLDRLRADDAPDRHVLEH